MIKGLKLQNLTWCCIYRWSRDTVFKWFAGHYMICLQM